MSNGSPHAVFDLEYIVNYVTPGYATAVYASASGVERIRTTAESHRRIAIVEVVWTPVLNRRFECSFTFRIWSVQYRPQHREGGSDSPPWFS